MIKRKLLFTLIVLAIISGFAWRQFTTHDAPGGQRSLEDLDTSSLATLRADFNSAADMTRIVLLLSPT